MADIRLVWDQVNQRADWTIVNGRVAAGADLESVVLLLLFTDRHAQPDYVPVDGTKNLRGWWGDSFQPSRIGSRLWQLERRKIVNRGALCAEANGMVLEALQPLIDAPLVSSVACTAQCPPPGPRSSGNLLVLPITLTLLTGKTMALQYAYTLT
jgi:phage gp46-like protein